MAMRVTKPEEEKRTDLIRELLRRHEPVIAPAKTRSLRTSSANDRFSVSQTRLRQFLWRLKIPYIRML